MLNEKQSEALSDMLQLLLVLSKALLLDARTSPGPVIASTQALMDYECKLFVDKYQDNPSLD